MYLAGFSVSGVINHYLKITFKQQRPERSNREGNVLFVCKQIFVCLARDRVDFYEIHGMPSAHAQSFFYFMTYLALFVILK